MTESVEEKGVKAITMAIPILKNKRIVLGITGGIAAYKSAMLASRLVQVGAEVDIVMTTGAQRFITPLTFQALTHRRVYADLFELPANENIPHIALADQSDLLLIAPATANTLAKIANGLADNLLTTIALATPAPILVAPAMETDMWQHPATQRNMANLLEWGVQVVGPAEGRLASGAMGKGRLAEPDLIFEATRQVLAQQGDLAGKRVVVTAGGTREALDPVRYITNRSSGKMGYALAEAARDRGASVTLISTATLPVPYGVDLVAVNAAAEMKEAVLTAIQQADALVMAAAVADYRPANVAEQKIKKSDDDLSIPLARTDDILLSVSLQREKTGWPQCVIGFAAETQDLVENAAGKLARKNLDYIVANDVSRSDAGFATDTNLVTILGRDEDITHLPLMTKQAVADEIWDRVIRVMEY
ncbi:MAG: bifunctional phosphopantothenoylcysteine decarboxylase/phosphopantothenate--cysteine ligase CoaBC [Chloroflexota bacterium]